MAIFASVTVAFGQTNASHNSTSVAPTGCTDNALNPIAGKVYPYSTAIDPTGGSAKWHVVAGTATQQFINGSSWVPTDEVVGGSYLLSTTPGTINPLTVASSPSTVSITWNSTGLAQVIADPTNKKLFVAVEYTGTTCANNLQVWEIKPINAFTIDVYNVESAGTLTASGATVSQCYSAVESATFDGTNVKMNYGTNTITYEIVAANFTGSFSSTVQVSGLQTGQTADISWGYTVAQSKSNAPIQSGVSNGTYGPILATVDDATTSTGAGVSIFVTLTVHNNGYEGLSNDGITLAATAKNSAGQDDVTTACVSDPGYSDSATHNLLRRPTINNPTPTPFLNKN